MSTWNKEFNEIPSIIKYISSYYKLAFKFARYSINDSPERIRSSQFEWVSLVSQFEHPLENEFFKSFWVPLESDSYDLFIDLSSEKFTLFEVHYFPFEPYQWYKKIWFEDMGEFLAWGTDPSIDIDKQLIDNDNKNKKFIDELFKKRKQLGFVDEDNEIVKDEPLPKDFNDETHLKRNIDKCSVKPMYTYFCAGYPSAYVSFIPQVAKELGINLKLEYHGCIIRTLYSDEYGLKITDAQVHALEIEEKNRDAVSYYAETIGEDWLVILKKRAVELLENKEDNGLPF